MDNQIQSSTALTLRVSPLEMNTERTEGHWNKVLDGFWKVGMFVVGCYVAARLGLPVPDSSWDSVDLAIPARRATSVSDSPVRRRSRRSEAAMTSSGAYSDAVLVDGGFVI